MTRPPRTVESTKRGFRMGQVIGSTDPHGAYPASQPHSPQDVLATMYRFMGIDHRTLLHDHSNRPVPVLNDGTPIAELA